MDLRLVFPAAAAWSSAFLMVAWPAGRVPIALALWAVAVCGVVAALLVERAAPPVGTLVTPPVGTPVARPVGTSYRRARRAFPFLGRSPPPGRRGHPRLSGILPGLALAAIAAALVSTAAAAAGAGRQPAFVVDAAMDRRHVTVTMRMLESPVVIPSVFRGASETRMRVRAMATDIRVGSKGNRVTVPMLVFLSGERAPRDVGIGGPRDGTAPGPLVPGEEAPRLTGIGSVVRVSGTLRPAAPEDDVAFLLFARGDLEVVERPPWLLAGANGLRTGFSTTSTRLPGDGGALLPGLAIGDTSAVSDRLDAVMKDSSLSHLTAVSGANCAVIVATVMAVTSAIGVSRRLRVGLSVLALGGFVVLVTPQPSVLRAAVMATIVLVALASGRPARGVPALALAVILLLTMDPWLSRDYGFVLSVLATSGLLLLAGPLTDAFARGLPRWVAAALALPCAAQLACQPVLILLTPTIPLYGVPANLLAAPAAPLATMIGLVACLLLPVAPAIGAAVAALAWVPSAWIASVASFLAGLPGARLPWLDGVAGFAVCAASTALLLTVSLRRGDRRSRWRVVATAVLVLLIGAYVGVFVGSGIRDKLAIPRNWQYAACDVGQGDAVLVNGGGVVALVDVGPDAALVEACLSRLGIERIDLLVLTHYDLDHVGGLDAVVDRSENALVGPPGTVEDGRLLARLRAAGVPVSVAERGMTGSLGSLGWRVLWPSAAPDGRRDAAPYASPPDGTGSNGTGSNGTGGSGGGVGDTGGSGAGGNDSSAILAFDGISACARRCLSSVFLGDLGEDAQVRLAAQNALAAVDVVKVAHHGSADQNARLYAGLGAAVGIVSVGADNTYGHPTDALLTMLARAGTTVVRTDVDGMVVVGAGERDGEIEVWREHPDEQCCG